MLKIEEFFGIFKGMRESKSINSVLEGFLKKTHLLEKYRFFNAVEVYNSVVKQMFSTLNETYAKSCTYGTLWVISPVSYNNFEIMMLKSKIIEMINGHLKSPLVKDVKVRLPLKGEENA